MKVRAWAARPFDRACRELAILYRPHDGHMWAKYASVPDRISEAEPDGARLRCDIGAAVHMHVTTAEDGVSE
jgi:hypothetical protein